MSHTTIANLPADAARRRGSPMQVLNTLLRYRFLLIGLPLVVAILVLANRFIGGSAYVATSRFVPEGGSSDASRLLGLASQFGVALPKQGDRESLDFYGELVKSQDVLKDVVSSKYSGTGGSGSRSLLDIYKIPALDSAERLRRGVAMLRLNLGVVLDPKANVVTLTINANNESLAEQINRRILDLINSYNLKKRQSRAAAERQFVEGRLATAQHELDDAEQAVRNFLESNHQYAGSPALMTEKARLERRVDLRQQIASSLSQSYEQARLEEVRNTPVVTVLDVPEGSARRNNRTLIKLMMALVPAFILALSLALAHDFLRRQRMEDPEEYERFVALRRRMIPWRGRRADPDERVRGSGA